MFGGMVAVNRNQNTLLAADVLEDNVWPSNCRQKNATREIATAFCSESLMNIKKWQGIELVPGSTGEDGWKG